MQKILYGTQWKSDWELKLLFIHSGKVLLLLTKYLYLLIDTKIHSKQQQLKTCTSITVKTFLLKVFEKDQFRIHELVVSFLQNAYSITCKHTILLIYSTVYYNDRDPWNTFFFFLCRHSLDPIHLLWWYDTCTIH